MRPIRLCQSPYALHVGTVWSEFPEVTWKLLARGYDAKGYLYFHYALWIDHGAERYIDPKPFPGGDEERPLF